MKIFRIELQHFRNHAQSQLEFSNFSNILLGENGHGKTNVLEAISFLCLTKSFYATADSFAIQHGKSFFSLEGKFISDSGVNYNVRVAYDEELKQKKFFVNTGEIEKLSTIIGEFPIVILSPENNSITFGSPAERRKFIDLIISQSNKVYVEEMIEYKRIVRQRNKILSGVHTPSFFREIEPWNEMLVHYGSKIIFRRQQFFQEFYPYILNNYKLLVNGIEEPTVEYISQFFFESVSFEAIQSAFENKLKKKHSEELRWRTTLIGPHRDEVSFALNGMQLRRYASQGQHKTFLIALKLAEFFYLKEQCGETPIFLLDDVFSELDEIRSQKLSSLIESLGQTFTTITSESVFGTSRSQKRTERKFYIKSGTVVTEEALT